MSEANLNLKAFNVFTFFNLMELVHFRMNPGEYALFRRLGSSFALNLLNVLIWKLVHRHLFISHIVNALLAPGGWYEVAWMYACLLVGLMLVSTSNMLVVEGPLWIMKSRKVIVFLLYSNEKLMVGWKLFVKDKKCWSQLQSVARW